jgi:serine/threonine protein kinase
LSGRTATGISAGTPFYMPRQQVINFKFSKPEVDVWAAAATFYKMVTGRYPRKYTKTSDPWLTTLKTPIIPIRTRDDSVPVALAAIIDQALIDQPEIYYKSAADFKNDLLKVI